MGGAELSDFQQLDKRSDCTHLLPPIKNCLASFIYVYICATEVKEVPPFSIP